MPLPTQREREGQPKRHPQRIVRWVLKLGENMTLTMEKILHFKILPRLMMLVMTVMYIRCLEWALSLPDISTQQASLISVVTGAMTGAFAVWLSHEK
jgi:hypothetical protein